MIKKFDEYINDRQGVNTGFIPETPDAPTGKVHPDKHTSDGKEVSGLKEVIEIDGLGKMKAKLDSGNTAMNALIVQDYFENKDDKTVKFEFNGEEKVFDVVKHVRIWHHGKSTERPVIKVDIKFNGKEYKDELIDLKISDLTGTKNYRSRMLLCKDFMAKANIVIDPSKEFKLTDENDIPKRKKKKFDEFTRDYVPVCEGFDIDMRKYHNLSALEQQYALVTIPDSQYDSLCWCITRESREKVIDYIRNIIEYIESGEKTFRPGGKYVPSYIQKSINQIKDKIKIDYLKKQIDKFEKAGGDADGEIAALSGIYAHLKAVDSKKTYTEDRRRYVTKSLVGEISISATRNSTCMSGTNIRRWAQEGDEKPELLKDQYVVHFIVGPQRPYGKLQIVKDIVENGFRSSDKDTDLSISGGSAGSYDMKTYDNGTNYGFLLKDLLDPDMDSNGYAWDLLNKDDGFFLVFKTDCVRMWTSDGTYEVIFPSGKKDNIDVGYVGGIGKDRMWYAFDGMKTYDLKGNADDINNRYKAKIGNICVDEKVKARGRNFRELNLTCKWITK